MKKLIYITILAVLMFCGLQAIMVSPEGATHYVGDVLTFRPSSSAFSYYNVVNWNFGDGTSGVTKGTEAITHSYNRAGTFTVTCSGAYRTTPNVTPTTETISITILDIRYIGVSPTQPYAGQAATFTAYNFNTPNNIRWDMGDGTIISSNGSSNRSGAFVSRRRSLSRPAAGSQVTHTYTAAGTYTVRAYDENGNSTIPVSVRVTVRQPQRAISYTPQSPRVDQNIQFQAVGFLTNTIEWNFGDGTFISGTAQATHRFMTEGTYTVSAKDASINHTPVTTTVTVLPENRYITITPPEVRTGETVTVQAFNFRGTYVWWDFGDGTQESGMQTVTHVYTRAGTYTIVARDENGESQVYITNSIRVLGINDEVNLQVAEIRLDNGKYYKVVPKNSKNIHAVLRMKMKGTGRVSGYWEVDGHPFDFFNEVVSQGMLKEIQTRQVPGIPTIDPGLHEISLRLTKPGNLDVQFPVLKYFVLPYELTVKPLTPTDGFVAKENEIPEFSWEAVKGANKYQVTFSDYLYSIMNNTDNLTWHDAGIALTFSPGKQAWDNIERNRWTYWKVRALDTLGNVLAESDIMDIKVVIATAEVSVDKVTDLEGRELKIVNGNISTETDDILVHGSIQYKGDSEFLVLRVYADNQLCDQLLFRDVKKGETRYFETSIPHTNKQTRVFFQVLKTSSPAVIVGIMNLVLNK